MPNDTNKGVEDGGTIVLDGLVPDESVLPKCCPLCGAEPEEYEEDDPSLERYEAATYECELVLYVAAGQIEWEGETSCAINRWRGKRNAELDLLSARKTGGETT